MTQAMTATAPDTNGFVSAIGDQVATEERLFELAQRKAAIYSKSSLVPKEYQGNIGNVLIAENMARRMGADTLMVMQNLYVVHGRPGWSATFLIASFNSNDRFSAIKYRFVGEPQTPTWGCQAYCTELSTGEVIEGTTITWDMANKEGWVNKNGSKWRTMPEQMFRYRAATFLIRSTAPEIGMGLLTKDEIEDMAPALSNGGEPAAPGIAGLKGRLSPELAPAAAEVEFIDAEPDFPMTEPPPDTDAAAEATDAEYEAAADPSESQLENLITFAKDKLREITGGTARRTAEILNGRKIDSFDLKQVSGFIEELEGIENNGEPTN